LIDTDFEYGPQPTKWETITLQNNRPTAYYIQQSPLTVTSITGQGSAGAPLTITGTFVVPAGSIIFIQNSLDAAVNGWGFTASGGTNTMTVVTNPSSGSSAQKYNAAGTYVYLGYFYNNSGFRLGTTSAFTALGGASIQATTATPHGLNVNSTIFIVGTTSTGTSINGAQIVSQLAGTNSFIFQNVNGSTTGATITNTVGQTNLFARSSGFVESRPFDGGVAFSASTAGVGQQLMRQTRRYFRYQSGKGIQFSTGTSLAPTLFVTGMSVSGTTVTVNTRFAHNLALGSSVRVSNCVPGAINGTYPVSAINSQTQFQYLIGTNLGSVTATGNPMRVSPINWYGASNRAGMFDQQNGMYFEYDGQQLYAVYRNSVSQVNGTVTVINGDATVSGSGTQFGVELIPGDFIVIRGQTYRIVSIASNTTLTISPEYRGPTITAPSYALISKTVDLRIPQSQWNIDKCNGTGPSGYNFDVTRMQMLYMDYSWYGAGIIRWGVRATNGQIIYCHQQQNNNIQFEAFLRSGNLPAHYECNGIVGYTTLDYPPNAQIFYGSFGISQTLALTPESTTITVGGGQGSFFNASGGVAQFATFPQGEFFYYSRRDGDRLLGCVRGIGGTTPRAYAANSTFIYPNSLNLVNADQFNPRGGSLNLTNPNGSTTEFFTYAGIYKNIVYGFSNSNSINMPSSGLVGVEFASTDTAPALSHWGSSVIMDGLFNDDKSLIFNYGMTTPVTTTSTSPIVLMAIRVAPAVDNGTTGLLGVKETINRMQLELNTLGLFTTGTGYLINLVLNGFASGAFSGSFIAPVQQVNGVTSSLSQIALNTNAITINGGESVYAAYSNTSGSSTIDLTGVRDLGNSIIGGGITNTISTSQTGFYPDGPDVLYVVATPLTSTSSTILARINWKEAQA
jgi:hypothetical protein